jgi:glucose-1-phosphate thymidylyltransferase
LVLTREGLAQDDLLVIAGDNLFSEPLTNFVDFARSKPATVAVHDMGSLEAIKKYGCITIDEKGVVTQFEEKPQNPKSTLAALALYYYSSDVLPLFGTYLAAGNNADQPGLNLQWLYTRQPVYTFPITGQWLDIGSKETLEEANKSFAKR